MWRKVTGFKKVCIYIYTNINTPLSLSLYLSNLIKISKSQNPFRIPPFRIPPLFSVEYPPTPSILIGGGKGGRRKEKTTKQAKILVYIYVYIYIENERLLYKKVIFCHQFAQYRSNFRQILTIFDDF